jgi:hypothetical protein
MSGSGFYETLVSGQLATAPFLQTESSDYLDGEIVRLDPRRQELHYQKAQALQVDGNQTVSTYFPVAQQSNLLVSGGNLDIFIQKGFIGYATSIVLSLSITNSTGASCTLSPAQLLIQQLQILVNSGGTILQTLNGMDMYLARSLLTLDELALESQCTNESAPWQVGNSLANGASITYDIPLHGIFLEQLPRGLYTAGISGDIRFRFLFSQLAIEVGSMPTITSASLRVCYREAPTWKTKMETDDYLSNIHDFKFSSPQPSTQIFTLATSTQYTMQLGAWNGMLSGMFFTVRGPLPLTGAILRTPIAIASFALLNNSGVNLVGGSQISAQQNKLQWNRDGFHVGAAGPPSINVYEYQFQEKCTDFAYNGRVTGGYKFSGREQLQFTTTAGMTPGSYQVDCWGYSNTIMRITAGNITVNQSG